MQLKLRYIISRMSPVVIAVMAFFSFLYYNCIFLMVLPWLSYSVPGAINIVLFTFLSISSFYFYNGCVFADPGRVPEEWTPNEDIEDGIQQVKKKTGGVRFCQKCLHYKPPRSHHCRICKRCVLRMDHHCPWMNNCIGHFNYKAFLCFLIYSLMALIHFLCILASFLRHTISFDKHIRQYQHNIHTINVWFICFQVFIGVLCSILVLALSSLLIWHIHLSFENKTTIEYHEGVTAKLEASKVGKYWRHPYDITMIDNMKNMFGDLVSFIKPDFKLRGDGIAFCTIHEK